MRLLQTLLVLPLLLAPSQAAQDVSSTLTPSTLTPSTLTPAPGLNMTFDPRTLTLAWSCAANATNVTCVLITEQFGVSTIQPRAGECACAFRPEPLHRGAELELRAVVAGRTVRAALEHRNPGVEGSAAQNLSCFIYEADFMNCSWARGPAAPGDVQYYLYIGDRKRKKDRECPHYVRDAGTHLGCHVSDLSDLNFHIFFLVNGTSGETRIQFLDVFTTTKRIERMSPPHDVSVGCNASHCRVAWEQPRTKTRLGRLDVEYQLDVQRQNVEPSSHNPPISVGSPARTQFSFPSPAPRAPQAVRVRAADARLRAWSAWSRPQRFGSEPARAPPAPALVAAALGSALLLGLAVRRFAGSRALFPDVPHVRDKVTEEHPVAWEDLAPGGGKGENEEILAVKEIS